MKKKGRVYESGEKKGHGGERTSLWALTKLNWANASEPEKRAKERNGLP